MNYIMLPVPQTLNQIKAVPSATPLPTSLPSLQISPHLQPITRNLGPSYRKYNTATDVPRDG